MVLIHEKITALLDQRRLKKRDLARALGVSPQTATDICKGRSAITLPHLRNLVSFFEIRAEFWLDNDRLEPEEIDRTQHRHATDELARAGMLAVQDPRRLIERLRLHAQQDSEAFLTAHPDMSSAERQFLGLKSAGQEPSIPSHPQASHPQVSHPQASPPQVAATPPAATTPGVTVSPPAVSPPAEAAPTEAPAGDQNEATAP